MERFTVNGAEVEFDLFDLDVLDRYLAGLDRVDSERQMTQAGEGAVATLSRICETILDFFDDQLGEGRAEELFGERVNAKAIFEGYKEFTGQVNSCIQGYTRDLNADQAAPVVSINRAQRRQGGKRK